MRSLSAGLPRVRSRARCRGGTGDARCVGLEARPSERAEAGGIRPASQLVRRRAYHDRAAIGALDEHRDALRREAARQVVIRDGADEGRCGRCPILQPLLELGAQAFAEHELHGEAQSEKQHGQQSQHRQHGAGAQRTRAQPDGFGWAAHALSR